MKLIGPEPNPINPFHDIGVVNHVLARQGGKRAVKNEHYKCHAQKIEAIPVK